MQRTHTKTCWQLTEFIRIEYWCANDMKGWRGVKSSLKLFCAYLAILPANIPALERMCTESPINDRDAASHPSNRLVKGYVWREEKMSKKFNLTATDSTVTCSSQHVYTTTWCDTFRLSFIEYLLVRNYNRNWWVRPQNVVSISNFELSEAAIIGFMC